MTKKDIGKSVLLVAIILMALCVGSCTIDTSGGNGGDTTVRPDRDNDGVPNDEDCAPDNPDLHTTYHLDGDTDGLPEPGGDICGGDTTPPGYTPNDPPWDHCPNDHWNTCGNNQLPTGTLTCTVAGNTVTATVSNVQDDGTVVRTDFWEGATMVGTDNTAPFSYIWTHVTTGSHTYVANLVDDDGADNDTNNCTVEVGGGTVGNPSVTIDAPANNSTQQVGTPFIVRATVVYATAGITNVAFVVDNAAATCNDTVAPYDCSVNLTTVGSHTITVTATAANGRTGSASISVGAVTSTTQSCIRVYGAMASTDPRNISGYGTGFYSAPPLPSTFPQMFSFQGVHEFTATEVVSPTAMSEGFFLMAMNFTPPVLNQDGTIYWFPYLGLDGVIQDGLGRGLATIQFYFLPNCSTTAGAVLLDSETVTNYQEGGNWKVWLDQGTDPVTGDTVDIDAGIVTDTDNDGIRNSLDNCIWVYNPDQTASVTNPVYNSSGARAGNACQDYDADNDTWLKEQDADDRNYLVH